MPKYILLLVCFLFNGCTPAMVTKKSAFALPEIKYIIVFHSSSYYIFPGKSTIAMEIRRAHDSGKQCKEPVFQPIRDFIAVFYEDYKLPSVGFIHCSGGWTSVQIVPGTGDRSRSESYLSANRNLYSDLTNACRIEGKNTPQITTEFLNYLNNLDQKKMSGKIYSDNIVGFDGQTSITDLVRSEISNSNL